MLEVKEKCATVVTEVITAVDSVVVDCTRLFEQLFEVLTSLQEDPNVHRLEIEVRELQEHYDEVKGTTHIVALTERLVKLQEAKALKE